MKQFAAAVVVLMAFGLTEYAHSDAVGLEQEEASEAQLAQQPEESGKSSRLSGMSGSAASATCRSVCMPCMGTPIYVPCMMSCMALALEQE